MKRILIVEDDVNLGTTLTGALEMQDYEVLYHTNGEQVMTKFREFKPDAVILDVILNGSIDGFEIGKLIRAEYNTPILFTTSRDGNEDFKQGFSIKNSDYVRKPYKLMEIALRLENLLSIQKRNVKKESTFQIGHFSFSPDEQSLRYDYEKIHLNNYESAVLDLLCKNIDTFISRKEIIEQIWHEKDAKLKEGSLNNIITSLRKYLNQDCHIELESRIKLGIKLKLKDAE
ncbi:MAG: response regulator transcription factor [Paludibacter sp.]|nr:response regulator transcription factor [Paludibacter sp.]